MMQDAERMPAAAHLPAAANPRTSLRAGPFRPRITRRGDPGHAGAAVDPGGLLQFQPTMLTGRFATQVIAPAGAGQPGFGYRAGASVTAGRSGATRSPWPVAPSSSSPWTDTCVYRSYCALRNEMLR
jgi:hypothetical protein